MKILLRVCLLPMAFCGLVGVALWVFIIELFYFLDGRGIIINSMKSWLKDDIKKQK